MANTIPVQYSNIDTNKININNRISTEITLKSSDWSSGIINKAQEYKALDKDCFKIADEDKDGNVLAIDLQYIYIMRKNEKSFTQLAKLNPFHIETGKTTKITYVFCKKSENSDEIMIYYYDNNTLYNIEIPSDILGQDITTNNIIHIGVGTNNSERLYIFLNNDNILLIARDTTDPSLGYNINMSQLTYSDLDITSMQSYDLPIEQSSNSLNGIVVLHVNNINNQYIPTVIYYINNESNMKTYSDSPIDINTNLYLTTSGANEINISSIKNDYSNKSITISQAKIFLDDTSSSLTFNEMGKISYAKSAMTTVKSNQSSFDIYLYDEDKITKTLLQTSSSELGALLSVRHPEHLSAVFDCSETTEYVYLALDEGIFRISSALWIENISDPSVYSQIVNMDTSFADGVAHIEYTGDNSIDSTIMIESSKIKGIRILNSSAFAVATEIPSVDINYKVFGHAN